MKGKPTREQCHDCKRCIWQYNTKCYCEEGCKFADINPEGKFKEVSNDDESERRKEDEQ